jgi:hypothetical protein
MVPPKIITDEQIKDIEKYAGYGFTIQDISYITSIPIATLKRKIKGVEAVTEAYERGRAIAKGFVIERLFDLIRNGEPSAIYFYLKCQCGWREKDTGIVESTASTVTIYLPEKDEPPTDTTPPVV